ncbi:MAG: Oligoendopeptidase F [Ktedonobacterales bacterium]|jgi:oligoendopeptidase F|nr:MAG: Oligoendopeptidase F [Ktedonobacterales bacterium]
MASATTLPKRSEIPTEYTWNLETIYATNDVWEADFARVTALLPDIRAYEGRLGESGTTMLAAFKVRDTAYEVWGRLFVYANMRMHEDSANSTYQALADRSTTLANDLNTANAYMTPEILAIPQERIESFLAETAGLDLYRHALDEINRQRAHVLSAEMEGLLAQAAELGQGPEHIFELFNNADLKLPLVRDEQGQEVRLTQGNYVAKFLESQNRDVRRAAFEAMLGTYRDYRNTLGATYAAQVKGDMFFARARKYEDTVQAALDPNNIPVSVYDNLLSTVDANLPKLHRYLELRKRLLGLDELHMYDLYVPMVKDVEYKAPFVEAKEQVARALGPLGENYVSALRTGFGARWIDVLENEGKRSGAYSWGSYGTNPFVLLNYQETMDSMFTLAHEMGHSMHSYFTWQTQPFPYASYTLFVAEVASTLNEALLTHYLLHNTTDTSVRKYVLNHALETFRTTLYRQTLFAEFEREAHRRAEAGEALTPELLSSVFKGLNDKYYGPVVTVDELIENEWARIPHFYSSYYVYQYATGISASAALAKGILAEGEPAVKRYLGFLSSGSSDYSINLLREAGVDLSTPAPVQQALDTFADYLAQFEELL